MSGVYPGCGREPGIGETMLSRGALVVYGGVPPSLVTGININLLKIGYRLREALGGKGGQPGEKPAGETRPETYWKLSHNSSG